MMTTTTMMMTLPAMITERAESSHDPQWAETGDHYLLKLFRDWIFHRQTDTGGPCVDWGFVVEALNKVCVRFVIHLSTLLLLPPQLVGEYRGLGLL
jgi:hypothetical protein